MSGISLTAKVDTVVKRLTIDSTDISNPNEKFNLSKGQKIKINWYRPADDDHWEFELSSPKGAFFNWYAFKEHVQIIGGGSTQISNASSQIMACLDLIAYTEGTDSAIGDGYRTGYNIIFTYDYFSDYSTHPRRIKCSGSLCSDAAGRYQFLSTTWDSLGLPSFSPENQDKGAIELIRRRGVYDLVEAGKIRQACVLGLSREWASLPYQGCDSYYPGQSAVCLYEVESLFVQAGGTLA